MKLILLLLLCIVLFSSYGQNSLSDTRLTPTDTVKKEDPDLNDVFGSWIEQLTIRQSFQGLAEKDEAAFLNIVHPSGKENSYNYSFAIGYNLSEVILFPNKANLTPFIEAQKNTLSEKKQNVFLTGVESTFAVNPLTNGKVVSFLIIKSNYKKDQMEKTESLQANLYYTPSFDGHGGKFYPLPDVVNDFEWIRFSYNPYAGIEYENRYQAKADSIEGNTLRLHLRVAGIVYPLSRLLKQRLEIIPDFTYRRAISNTTTAEKDENSVLKLDVNVILVKKKMGDKNVTVKFGVTYKKGVDPSKGFQNQEMLTYTLKLKV